MRCEVVAIGTELLLGQIVDTNSSWLGEQLALAGIDSHFQTKVGDNHERIVASLRLALSRSDAVIVCGGLGPTQDDITREAIAEVMGVALERHPEVGERIRARFQARGRRMPENNLRQADVPAGASLIAQMPGTAPGLVCPVGERVIYAVPGVPYELREMFDGTILADLRRRARLRSTIKSRVLRTWGESESGLAETLADRIAELDRLGNPTLAFLASGIEGIKVRITAKAGSREAAEALLAEEEACLRERLGNLVFAADDDNMESTVVAMLAARNQTLALSEGATGGLMSARLGAVPAAEEVLAGGIVVPNDEAANAIGAPGARGVAVAASLAEVARARFAADIGLANTAAESREEEARGTTHLALATAAGTRAEMVHLPGDRIRVRQYAAISLLNLLRLALLDGARGGAQSGPR